MVLLEAGAQELRRADAGHVGGGDLGDDLQERGGGRADDVEGEGAVVVVGDGDLGAVAGGVGVEGVEELEGGIAADVDVLGDDAGGGGQAGADECDDLAGVGGGLGGVGGGTAGGRRLDGGQSDGVGGAGAAGGGDGDGAVRVAGEWARSDVALPLTRVIRVSEVVVNVRARVDGVAVDHAVVAPKV